MSSVLAYVAILFTLFTNAVSTAVVTPEVTQPEVGDSGWSKRQLARVPAVTEADHSRGSQDAQVILVEYGGLECPFCKRFQPTLKQALKEYDGKVRWVYRHFPLEFHTNGQAAAEAAECVAKDAGHEAFWKFVDLYYQKTSSGGTGLAKSRWPDLYEAAGANKSAVQACVDSGEMTGKIRDQVKAAERAGVSGTPAVFIVTKDGVQDAIMGQVPYAQVKAKLEKYVDK